MSQGPDNLNFDVFDANRYYDSIEGMVSVNGTAQAAAGLPSQYVTDLFETSLGKSKLDLEQFSAEDADFLYEAGMIYNFKKDYVKAIENIEKAHRIYSHHKQYLKSIEALTELAWMKFCHDKRDGVAKSSRLFGDVLKLVNVHIHEPGMNEVRARIIHYQGLIKYREKKFGEALKHFMIAKTFCQPDGLEAAHIMDSLSVHYERVNDYARAIQTITQSLAIKEQKGASYEIAISKQILGRIYILKEEYTKAYDCLYEAMEVSEDMGDLKRIARIKNDLIRLKIYQQDIQGTQLLIDEVLAECQDSDLRIPYAMALFYRAYLAYAQEQIPQCRMMLERDTLPIFKRFEYQKGYGMAVRLLACVEHNEGFDTKAIELMSEAISIFREENHPDELAKTYFELGKLYVALGDEKLAITSLLEAFKIAEFNGLSFLISYIEDEIFRLDENQWQMIVEKRARNERVFERQATLEETLVTLGHKDESAATTAGMSSASKSLISLLRVGQTMAAEQNLDRLLEIIKLETEEALEADRCTVFLYDRDTNELWSRVASGLDGTQEIRFPAHLGLAGYVTKTGEILNIKEAYDDPRFNQEIDKKTGYKTDTILCLPMRNRRHEIIGVFQVLNKKGGYFEVSDEELLSAIASSAGVAIENATLAKEIKVSFESFVKTLSSTIDARDPITAGHSERVAQYSLLIGEEMNLSGNDLDTLKYASLLHDIGKIGIREDILKKDGRLTEKEYRHIQKHVYYTHEILKNVHFERHLRMVPEIAASHHEKMDGSGYHRGLQAEEIPLSGRILALSDVFDAITSRRHYRNRMPFDRVINIVEKDAGTHFDPDCVASFFNVKLLGLGRVLLTDEGENYDEGDLILLRKLDRNINIGEYRDILKKDMLTKGEAEIHRIFNNIYHRAELGDLD